MNFPNRTLRALATASLATLGAASAAGAQAWNYPSFQQARVAEREFNFLIADGGRAAGTTLLAQWREGVASRSQLSVDLGIAESDIVGSDEYILIGGQFAYQLTRAHGDMPADLLLTVGANAALGDPFTLLRVPVGVVAGHRFPLEGGMALTPFAHPRLSVDHCGDCGVDGEGETDVNIDFDLGFEFQFNPQLALRLSATLAGSGVFDDSNGSALGLSVAWTPRGARAAQPRRGQGRRR